MESKLRRIGHHLKMFVLFQNALRPFYIAPYAIIVGFKLSRACRPIGIHPNLFGFYLEMDTLFSEQKTSAENRDREAS